MSVEAATYIADLQPTNPPATDPRSQGDDHLRLIKSVLQNTFSGASRQIQVPGIVAVSGAYSVQKTDGESTIYCNTASGALNLTLPLLLAADKGWRVFICKTTSDVNPVFVAAPSGNISSGGVLVAKARRCVPGARVATIWDGVGWFIERTNRLPIGSIITYWGNTLPAGFEWPNGQTLAAANYPEYNIFSATGATPDHRGYADICLDNLGGAAAGRLPNGFINGSTLGATGGADGSYISGAQVPSLSSSGSNNITVNGSALNTSTDFGQYLAAGSQLCYAFTSGRAPSTITSSGTNTISVTYSNPGQVMRSSLQPSIMMGKILVVE